MGALDGLRVLDLTWGVAGPIATMLLADNGAQVTRIEGPRPDPMAAWPGARVWARGKRSAVLDLGHRGDRDAFLALAAAADVVVEGFRPGVTARLGIDHDTLSGANPRLVYCSVTAYGRGNRHSQRPGYDALVAARLGVQWENRSWPGGPIDHLNDLEPACADMEVAPGARQGADREGPIFSYSMWPSLNAAMLAAAGISAALLARERTGRGQWVETSLLQGVMAATMGKWQRVENPLAEGYRMWATDNRAPKGNFLCADGKWVHHWVPNPRFVLSSSDGDTLAVCKGVDNVRDDPERIGAGAFEIVVLNHYWPQMVEAMSRFPSDQWVDAAREYGTPLQTVRTPEEALHDPALINEGVVVDTEDPGGGRLRHLGLVYRLDRTPGRVSGRAPRRGEHTHAIRAEAAATPRTVREPSPPAAPPASGGPLHGVVVLDLGFAVAGPYGTQLLADLGANVIKVNAFRDPWWHCTHIAMGANRGKRSVGMDLKNPDGMAALHRLVARADVVHSNMRYRAAERLGVDEVSLRAINPSLVYCHTRGFEDGPRSDSPANDQTGNALSGTEYEDGGCHDGGRPFWSLTSMGDTGNGYLSVIGVLQALLHRARTGEGQRVDTSILNAGMLTTSYAALRDAGDGQGWVALERPRLDRMQIGLSALYRLYRTADGWLCVAVVETSHWEAFAGAMGDASLVANPRFATPEARRSNDRELAAVLERRFLTRSAPDWFEVLDAAGVPVEIAAADYAAEFLDDPEMIAAGRAISYDHPELGRFQHSGVQIDFSATPTKVQGPPPLVGQHTREVLLELGFSDSEIDSLCGTKAVFETMTVNSR